MPNVKQFVPFKAELPGRTYGTGKREDWEEKLAVCTTPGEWWVIHEGPREGASVRVKADRLRKKYTRYNIASRIEDGVCRIYACLKPRAGK